MTWTYFICETISGRKLDQVQPTSAQATRKLNGIGTGTHEFVTATLGTGTSSLPTAVPAGPDPDVAPNARAVLERPAAVTPA